MQNGLCVLDIEGRDDHMLPVETAVNAKASAEVLAVLWQQSSDHHKRRSNLVRVQGGVGRGRFALASLLAVLVVEEEFDWCCC